MRERSALEMLYQTEPQVAGFPSENNEFLFSCIANVLFLEEDVVKIKIKKNHRRVLLSPH